MKKDSIRTRLAHAWSVFRDNERFAPSAGTYGRGYTSRPDRRRASFGTEATMIASIYNRIAIDAAAIPMQHVRVNQNGSFINTIDSGLNECLTIQANIDQTGRAFMQDVILSLFDEGSVAIVPVDTTKDPKLSGSFIIETMRVAKILEWYPKHVRVQLYNDKKGYKEDVTVLKETVAIVENPLYAVMNEQNSTMKRLAHKLSLLDGIDDASGSGKLDLIIQLPYVIKTQARREQAEIRRKDIETQLKDSKYGIAYTDGSERVTQLNRPAENNLMTQITYLTSMLYSQLGITENVFNGTADEAEMLNYYNRTVEPVLSAVADSMKRMFLTKTARTQGQSIVYFREPFKLVPVEQLSDIADKFTRNEILSSNEFRAIVGFKPADDPRADELRNKNLNEAKGVKDGEETPEPVTVGDNDNKKDKKKGAIE